MKELFFGSIASRVAYSAVFDANEMLTHLNKIARDNLPYRDGESYIAALQAEMCKRYNLAFKISFFDIQFREPVDIISGLSEFQLLIDLEDNGFYSKVLH